MRTCLKATCHYMNFSTCVASTGQDLLAWQVPSNYTGLQDLGRFLRFTSRNGEILVSFNTIQGIALILMILRTLWLASLVMQQVSMITSTLVECVGPLLDLSVTFLIVTIGIAMVGYTSFGHRSKTFSTFETGYRAVAEFALAFNSGGKRCLLTSMCVACNNTISIPKNALPSDRFNVSTTLCLYPFSLMWTFCSQYELATSKVWNPGVASNGRGFS